MRGAWARPLGLVAVTLSLSAVDPLVLVAVPFAFLALGYGDARSPLLVLLGILALVLTLGGRVSDGVWMAERAWAIILGGSFLGLSLAQPGWSLSDRAIGAVGLSGALSAGLLALIPGAWGVLDWMVGSRLLEGAATALEVLRTVRAEGVTESLEAALFRTAQFQGRVFPALLGLASTAALALGWWLHGRLSEGRGFVLPPLMGFRFNDALIWVFIAGVAAVVSGLGDPAGRMGMNALVFMAGLYALRGMAVVVALNGGITAVGVLVVLLGLLFVAPLILVGALIIGLGDTWLDIRTRAAGGAG